MELTICSIGKFISGMHVVVLFHYFEQNLSPDTVLLMVEWARNEWQVNLTFTVHCFYQHIIIHHQHTYTLFT